MRGYISIGKTLLTLNARSSCQLLNGGATTASRRAAALSTLTMQQTKQLRVVVNSISQIRTVSTSNARLGSTLQFKLADIGEGIAEVSIKEWYVKVGDTVKQFDKICEVQSDKATVTITSRYDGLITKIYYNVDDTAFVGKPLVDIETEGAEGGKSGGQSKKHSETISDSLERIEAPPAAVTPPSSDFRVNKVLATPAVRKMAMDYKLNITDVPGSGKDGRVLKEDVIRYMEQNAAGSKTAPAAPKTVEQPVHHQQQQQHKAPAVVPMPVRPVTVQLAADRKEAIKGVRKAMARTMTLANQIPHFSYCDEYNMNTLVEQRGFFKHMAKERGISLSYMPFIIKACSMSLHSYPLLNAYVDDKCDNITYKAGHNIGVAIDTPDGLIVPNIKNVESKSIFEIAYELNRLQSLATASKLAPSDLNGGTFTLSNIGSIGGTYMKPVILPPEVAIGALGKIQKVPRYDHENKLVPVSLMQVSWSADHRVVDGATMARFSNQVKKYIENLNLLLVDLK